MALWKTGGRGEKATSRHTRTSFTQNSADFSGKLIAASDRTGFLPSRALPRASARHSRRAGHAAPSRQSRHCVFQTKAQKDQKSRGGGLQGTSEPFDPPLSRIACEQVREPVVLGSASPCERCSPGVRRTGRGEQRPRGTDVPPAHRIRQIFPRVFRRCLTVSLMSK